MIAWVSFRMLFGGCEGGLGGCNNVDWVVESGCYGNVCVVCFVVGLNKRTD